MEILKSERFWLALIAMAIVGGLSIMGRITGGEGVSALMALLAGFGVGRGVTADKAMKVLLPFFLVVSISAAGCASFGAMKTIDTSVKGVQLVSDAIMPGIHSECMDRAKACAAKGDKVCAEWKACDSKRDKFKLAIDSTQDALVIIANIVEAYCKDHKEVEACK